MFVDAHLDLAYNALRHGRDLTRSLAEVRAAEAHVKAPPNGVAMVTLPELRRAGFGVVFGSVFCLPRHQNRDQPDNETLTYTTAAEAHACAMRQLDYYHRLADELEWLRLVDSRSDLDDIVADSAHSDPGARQNLLGIVPLMEGADAIREPEELELWVERGLRVIGPAWDETRYAPGAWSGGGGFTRDGEHLLEIMAAFNLILDITHLSEKASLEALERYPGPVVATHCNARRLVDGERQLSDTQIRLLAERDGIMGIVLYNRFLKKGYVDADPKENVRVADVVAHIDHVCQVLGTAAHVGLGSDLDGGFGREDAPAELDSCADLGKIGGALAERGYSAVEVNGIMGDNWVRLLRDALP